MRPRKSPSRRRRPITNAIVLLVTIIVVVPILFEVCLRAGITLGVKALRNPELYADYYSDDDYWKLARKWDPPPALTGVEPIAHPTLGWAPRRSEENPLGVIAAKRYKPDHGPGTVLFFGDSFTAGVALVPMDRRVPQQLGDLLQGPTVYNYGVGGYGVDQIYLRMKDTIGEFDRPYVVFGLLTMDLDRSVLTFFSNRPKARFVLDAAGQLELTGTPVPPDPVQYLEDHPPRIHSYTAALVTRSIQKKGAAPYAEKEREYGRGEKIRLNGAILEGALRACREGDLPILFVIYYTRIELRYEGWREGFLHDLFTRMNVPYIDVKQVLLRRANGDVSKASSSYYLEKNGHLNELGSRLVAEAIAEYMTGRPVSQGVEVARNTTFDVTKECTLPSWRMSEPTLVKLPCWGGEENGIELMTGSQKGNAVTLKIDVTPAMPTGPAFLSAFEAKAGDPRALVCIVTAMTKDGKEHKSSAEHPGDGQWHRLEVAGELPPVADLSAIYLTISLRPVAEHSAMVRSASLRIRD